MTIFFTVSFSRFAPSRGCLVKDKNGFTKKLAPLLVFPGLWAPGIVLGKRQARALFASQRGSQRPLSGSLRGFCGALQGSAGFLRG